MHAWLAKTEGCHGIMSYTYRKRRIFGGIKVWRISKETNLAEESLANFSTRSIAIFALKIRGEYIHVLVNGGWRSPSITERTSELAEAMAEEGNLLLRVPSGSGK